MEMSNGSLAVRSIRPELVAPGREMQLPNAPAVVQEPVPLAAGEREIIQRLRIGAGRDSETIHGCGHVRLVFGGEKPDIAERVHDCIGRLLADLVIEVAKSGEPHAESGR